ncbi:uncharacterized protein LOC112513692 [Cynara cardunculus var. scolymus]|uniref:Uncharacterized protein n=1 Tax=Cynara cardunculus var. scolymus TaxID=59895 RepID=A0A103Y725_CYNCS|nr:uncharacterized protein LOC112513692 [Cynara cardunculus var. scolymus]KVI03700.1 Protein of unknown function DUF4228 [Cynara cardunculus var. scolymus]
MGNTLRCCLSCLLPCGALDLIRIVHLNGYVEEITHPITAGEVLTNYPNHVLSKPSSQGDVVRRILVLSTHSELKRGGIYFLIPASSIPENKRKPRRKNSDKPVKIKAVMVDANVQMSVSGDGDLKVSGGVVAEKNVGRQRVRRSVDGGDWRPHLESIFEEQ